MNKRGSHVGIVLSFVVFVTFLIFLYTTLEPIAKIDESKKLSLNGIKLNFLENVEGNLTTKTVELINLPTKCIKIMDRDSFISNEELLKVLIKDVNEEKLVCEKSGGGLEISQPSGKILKLYIAEGFNGSFLGEGTNSYGGCEPVVDTEYSFTSTKISKYPLKQKTINLFDNYTLDYNGLKTNLGVPSDSEFGFSFIYNNGTEISTSENIPSSTSVFAESYNIEYLDNAGNINVGKLIIRIW